MPNSEKALLLILLIPPGHNIIQHVKTMGKNSSDLCEGSINCVCFMFYCFCLRKSL